MMNIQLFGCLVMCWMLVWPVSVSADEGRDVYMQACAVCHAAGVQGIPGAPKLGSYTDWSTRLVAGRAGLVQSALKGKGAMPPKGGDASLSDMQTKAALDYMLSKAGVKPKP